VTIQLTTNTDPQGQVRNGGGDTVSLVVCDNGRGMKHTGNGHGLGVAGMRERVEALGGHLAIDSKPDGGVRVSAMIPVAAAALDEVV
jgi:signal transduction histidine kinase